MIKIKEQPYIDYVKELGDLKELHLDANEELASARLLIEQKNSGSSIDGIISMIEKNITINNDKVQDIDNFIAVIDNYIRAMNIERYVDNKEKFLEIDSMNDIIILDNHSLDLLDDYNSDISKIELFDILGQNLEFYYNGYMYAYKESYETDDEFERRKTNLENSYLEAKSIDDDLILFKDAQTSENLNILSNIESHSNQMRSLLKLEEIDATFYANQPPSIIATLKKTEDIESKKTQFIEALSATYGFDKETSSLIYQLMEGINTKFYGMDQKTKDWLFNRVITEMFYGKFNEDDLSNIELGEAQWDLTAGDLTKYFRNPQSIWQEINDIDILISLGLSEEQAYRLRYNLIIQHKISGGLGTGGDLGSATEVGDIYKIGNSTKRFEDYFKEYNENNIIKLDKDEFISVWNQMLPMYSGMNDYTHQSATTSIHLSNTITANIPIFNTFVESLSGWRGDTTTDADAVSSIGNDDYMADLDSVNIINMMNDSGNTMDYITAHNLYYKQLESGEINRASQFLENEGGYDKVQQIILKDLKVDSNLNTSEKMEELKKQLPDVYNFLLSLNGSNNEMEIYADK